jgi:hypothetical protein
MRRVGSGYGSAPSKAFGHPMAAIDWLISVYLCKSLAAAGSILAIGLVTVAPLRGALKAIQSLGNTWSAFPADFDAFISFAMETPRMMASIWRFEP